MSNTAPFETEFAHSVAHAKYMRPHGESHWSELAHRVVSHPLASLESLAGRRYQAETSALFDLVNARMFMPGGRYLYATGNDFHQTQNCLLLRCDDSREGWADLSWKAEMSLLTGAGIGTYWGDVRPGGTPVGRTGGVASGPLPKAIATNEQGRAAVQGGDRRAAIWGGLLWSHADIFKWITAKDWPDYIKAAKAEDYSVPAPLDMTNISVCLDDEFFYWFGYRPGPNQFPRYPGNEPYAPDGSTWHDWAQRVYWATVDHMTQTGEPGFSVDTGEHVDEKLRNACTEIVSADDSDVCNLGGLVLPRFNSPHEFGKAVRLGTLFLTAGSVYSDLPYPKVDEVRTKNRRLGLDLLGIHEFCLRNGVTYGSDDAMELLEPYMAEYRRSTEWAHQWQDEAGLSLSVATRAGSPTGTRGIVAETTTSWEPVTYAACERDVITSRAHERDSRTTHYIIDPTVNRLLREGVLSPDDDIEDSASLAYDYERRFAFQAYAQEHIDQAISMTINLPHVMKSAAERRAFGETLIKYLPRLRGITVYPNGAIPGQPIRPVPLTKALEKSKILVEESEDKCASGVCGL